MEIDDLRGDSECLCFLMGVLQESDGDLMWVNGHLMDLMDVRAAWNGRAGGCSIRTQFDLRFSVLELKGESWRECGATDCPAERWSEVCRSPGRSARPVEPRSAPHPRSSRTEPCVRRGKRKPRLCPSSPRPRWPRPPRSPGPTHDSHL